MTGLLEKALHRLEALPADEQDAIAAQILQALDAEAIAAIQIGIDAVERGRIKPARQALAELQEKLGLSS